MKKNTTKKQIVTRKPKTKPLAVFTTHKDATTALLVVSLLVNAFVFCVWLTLQITAQYDKALYDFFILR